MTIKSAFFRTYNYLRMYMGEAVRELKSDTSESYDLKAISEIAIENEAFSSKNSLKNAVEYRDNFQSVSSRHLENEFLDGLGGVKFSSLPDVKYSIYFKKSKDSKIKIGKGFTFFSGNGLNPLSPGRKGTIFAEGNAFFYR